MEDIPSKRDKIASTLRSWRRSRLFRTGVVLTFLLVVAIVSAPFAIGFALERAFLVRGADRVSVRDVDFNPFAGTLSIEGLHVSRDAQRALHVGRASANFAWWGLLGKRIRFQSLVIERLDVRVDRVGEAGMIAAGILLKRAEGAEGAEGVEEPREARRLNFGVDSLEVIDSRVRYQDPAVQSVLQIDQANLERLASWEGRTLARLDLVGRWNDGRVTIGADFDAFADPPRANADILLEGLSLEPWSPLLPLEAATLQGRLWLDLNSELVDDDGRMRLREQGTLRIEQPRLSVADGVYGAAEVELKTSSESLPFASPQLLSLEGELALTELGIEAQPARGQVQRVAWKGRIDVGASKDDGDPRVQGVLTLDTIDVDAGVARITSDTAEWDGSVELDEAGPSIEGALSVKQLDVDADGRRSVVAGARWNGELRLDEPGPTMQGVLELDQLSVDAAEPQFTAAGDGARWQGRVRLVDDGASVDGGLELGPSTVQMAESQLTAATDGARWKGNAQLAEEGPSVAGDLEIDALRIDDGARGLRLADLARLVLRDIDVNGSERVAVGRTEVDDLRLVQPASDLDAQPLLEAKALAATDLQIDNLDALSIDTVSLTGMTTLVRRQDDRNLYLISELQGSGAERAAPSAEETAAARPVPKVRINRIEIIGESAILLEDESVTPAFRARLPVTEASATGIDSTRSDQFSDVRLKLKGKYSEMVATGKTKLLSARPTLSGEAKITSLELPPLSPFTVQSSGYAIRGGRADIDVQLSVVEGQMDGKTDLVLHNLSVAPEDVGKTEEVNQQLRMPLNLALSVLKDKDDDIYLEVPITGDIRDPGFSFRDAFNQAMIKATRLASLQYLKLALGPYGVAITLAQVAGTVAGEVGGYVSLKPVVFVPGKEETEIPERDYGERLGQVLRDRPGLELQVCAFYVTADMAALKFPLERDKLDATQVEQLTVLASNRASRVKEYMVDVEGIEPERLFVCNPSFDPAADAQPRVELGI